MIETVCQVELPVDETLKIKKNRLMPLKIGKKEDRKRISIVTGIHGDELEGQYICYEVIRRIKEKPELLNGIVDIYPAMNPLGIDSVTRGIPGFELDMNRIFPGDKKGAMTEYIADQILTDISGSDLCVDLHASNIYLMEVPQIRINQLHREKLLPFAKQMNVDFIWIHGANTVLESTLAYSLNDRGIPTLVVEAGVGMRITEEYGEQITDGLFYVMQKLGIWQGEEKKGRCPILSDQEDGVYYFNASQAGIFLPEAKHGAKLEKGELVGRIVNPLSGEVLSEVRTFHRGILFTIREYPVVEEGSLLGRLLVQDEKRNEKGKQRLGSERKDEK